jgi:hypothetical protein
MHLYNRTQESTKAKCTLCLRSARMDKRAHAVRNGLLCAFAFLLCTLIAQPFVRMGFMDDWSYIWSARAFAQTGHFAYVWSSPILGWQILWGALFIKLFGFSFTVLRMSMLPVAMLSIFIFHAILLRFGVTAQNAIIGALTFGLSPLFLPIAVSFMSDVPGICSLLLCIYLCQRAVDSETNKAAILWLLLAASSNLLSGTVRQTSWLGLLVIIPSTAIFLRKRRGIIPAVSAMWIGGCAFIYACMHWFSRQPGALHEHILRGSFKDPAHPSVYLVFQLLGSLLLILLLIYPLLIPWLSHLPKLNRAAWTRIGITTTALSLVQWKLRWMLPWLFYVIVLEFDNTNSGPVLGKDILTFPLPVWLRIAIATLITFTALVAAESLWSWPWKSLYSGSATANIRWREVLWLTGPFAICYTTLLVPRGLYNFISDRYLLDLLPIAIIIVLLLYQQCVGSRLPTVSLVVLACLALLTVAGTHDWFAAYRARLAAANELRSSGVPRVQIQGGFEYDSWTRIENSNEWNSLPRIPLLSGNSCVPSFAPLGIVADQKYTVIYVHKPCLTPSTYTPVSYRAWLPPFHRQIQIEKVH